MKKTIFLLFGALSFFIVCNLSFAGQGDFGLVSAKGIVNTSEVGGKGLYVFSMWNSGRKTQIGADGSFSVAILSNTRPQKLSARDDDEKTRALALVLSQDSQNIILDATSTAMAILFSDPRAIKNAQEMEKYSKIVAQAKSFQDFVIFLKKNLSLRTIEELARDEEYVTLFEKCNREIFEVDRAAINNSLYEAQGQLEKSFSQ
ncbi:MAG: hypothetical protein WCX16_00515 [Candidatus Omnitrophota bacterium]